MTKINIIPNKLLETGFLTAPLVEENKRMLQNPRSDYRSLTESEIIDLKANRNYCPDWSKIMVSESFDCDLIRDSSFYGIVRIGALIHSSLQHKNFALPIGIYNSKIITSDIGDNCAIHDVKYLSHYIVGDTTIIHDVSEIQNTFDAKYGFGTLKDNEKEEDRVWLELGNETGTRGVLNFDKIKASDAYLMYKYKEDEDLQRKLVDLCQKEGPSDYGYFGTIGSNCVIKATKFIINSNIGDGCYIKGANKLKSITVVSDVENPVQIGEGCELVNGILQKGSKAFYGVKAVRFVLSQNATLKYGARLINSYLGDNSTISCCEVLNSLIFPNHEQHHNNSFLVATTFLGQTNMAAGATVGSNHNSRANDGEIIAGRGFWPGLSVTLKHNSKFASFNLIAKGNYPAELNIKLPFCLVSNGVKNGKLIIMPGYWFRYNMYAVARNAWKFGARDKRADKTQQLEYNFIAPDTANEIVDGVKMLEEFKATLPFVNGNVFLSGKNQFENHPRGVEILKVKESIETYKDQLILYFIECLLASKEDLTTILSLNVARENWVNLGGQLIAKSDVNKLKSMIKSEEISSWSAAHQFYQKCNEDYSKKKLLHALACLQELGIIGDGGIHELNHLFDKSIEVKRSNANCVKRSRMKDFENAFRKITTDSEEEFEAVFGDGKTNSFIASSMKSYEDFKKSVMLYQSEIESKL